MLADIVGDKAISVSFKTSKITLEVIISVLNKLLEEKVKEITGKQSLKHLRKKGNIEVVEVTDETLKKLKSYLKKYNIDYSILKDKTQENSYSLFFRSYDAEILNKAMNGFMLQKFKEKESIKDKIKKAKEKYQQISKERKIKNIEKQKGQSL